MAEPTPTQIGFSYEYGVDVYQPGESGAEGKWLPVRFISEVNPQVESREIDAATYDDLGAEHPIKVGEIPSLDFFVQQHRTQDGGLLPEMVLIQEATMPTATGEKATLRVRYYDKPASGKPDPLEAFEMVGTVSRTRATTDNASIGGWNVSIKGQGARKKIDNPAIKTTASQ